MKSKLITYPVILIIFAFTGTGFSQGTTSKTISNEEATEFWTKFKSFCQKKDLRNIRLFVADPVQVQRINFGEIELQSTFSIDDIKKNIPLKKSNLNIIPVWSEKMDSVLIDKSVSQDFGESGNLYWAYGVSNESPDIYIYISGKNGPVSYRNVYFFQKIDGVIKLFKVISEEL